MPGRTKKKKEGWGGPPLNSLRAVVSTVSTMSSSGSSDEDEEEQGAEPLAILLIGKSRSGKSTLAKALLRKHANPDYPVFSVNDRKDSPYNSIEWSKLPELSHCALVVSFFSFPT